MAKKSKVISYNFKVVKYSHSLNCYNFRMILYLQVQKQKIKFIEFFKMV